MEIFNVNFLEPGTTRFRKGPGNVLQLEIGEKISYPQVRVFQACPLNNRKDFISVRDATNEDLPEVGLIKDLSQFPATIQGLIMEKLEERYFVPVITRIISLEEEGGDRLQWEVETDKGLRKFAVRDPYEHLRSLGNEKLLIIDVDNCRYKITNYALITKKIKEVLSRHVYI